MSGRFSATVVFPDYRTAPLANVYCRKSHNQQNLLRFVVLVHFVVARFLICCFPVFEKQEGGSIFGCLLFLASSRFCAAICGENLRKKEKAKKRKLPFGQKNSLKIFAENRPYGLCYGLVVMA